MRVSEFDPTVTLDLDLPEPLVGQCSGVSFAAPEVRQIAVTECRKFVAFTDTLPPCRNEPEARWGRRDCVFARLDRLRGRSVASETDSLCVHGLLLEMRLIHAIGARQGPCGNPVLPLHLSLFFP